MFAVYLDRKLERFQRQVQYSLDFLFETSGYSHRLIYNLSELRDTDIILVYGMIEPTEDEVRQIAQGRIMFFIPCEPELLKEEPLRRSLVENMLTERKFNYAVPILTNKEKAKPVIVKRSEDYYFGKYNFDLIANIFFHLSGKEDDMKESKASGKSTQETRLFHHFSNSPFVNELLWIFENFTSEAVENFRSYSVRKAYWPQGEQMAAALTYNIIHLQKWNWKRLLSSVVEDIGLLLSFRWKQWGVNVTGKFRYLSTNEEPWWNFPQ
ncbi:MAG: hypothetical protein K8S56_11050, partial [Candidatus Cloacimonetes bacterium]|nr:hypothetical protein [Candidatus Cloacimonadota bacterium]